MILEDLTSVIDCRLSHVVLGIPFVKVSNLRYDRLRGTIQFSNDLDRFTYWMPYWVNEFRFVPPLDKDNIGAIEDINDEDKKKGMDYVWNKRNLYYKDCLNLGPKYKVDMEIVRMIRGAIEKHNGKT